MRTAVLTIFATNCIDQGAASVLASRHLAAAVAAGALVLSVGAEDVSDRRGLFHRHGFLGPARSASIHAFVALLAAGLAVLAANSIGGGTTGKLVGTNGATGGVDRALGDLDKVDGND